MTAKGEKRFSYAVLALPAILIYLAVVTFPTFFSVALSFMDFNPGQVLSEANFVGFHEYRLIFSDPTGAFFSALQNNMLIVAISVFGQIPLGFALAYIISRQLIKRGTKFFQSMIFMPYVISPIIIGVLFNVFIFGRRSVFIEIVRLFTDNPETIYAIQSALVNHQFVPVLVVILWMFTGFYMIIFVAHMGRIDPEVIESARIDGAGEGKILTRVVLPLMKNEIITCSMLAISGSLRTFDLIFGMTGTVPETRVLSIFMYDSAFGTNRNWPLANAISTVMVLISILLIIIVQLVGRYLNRGDRERKIFH